MIGRRIGRGRMGMGVGMGMGRDSINIMSMHRIISMINKRIRNRKLSGGDMGE